MNTKDALKLIGLWMLCLFIVAYSIPMSPHVFGIIATASGLVLIFVLYKFRREKIKEPRT